MNTKLRLFISAILTIPAAVVVSGLFLSKPRPLSASPTPGFPTYVPGNFTFTSPNQLIRPLNMVEGEIDDSAEPEIKIDIFGNIYVTGIHGLPGGLDFWKSTD